MSMNISTAEGQNLARSGMGFVEFVVISAALTAITAMSIDIMLPALPAIGSELGVMADNDRQLIIVVFMLAFAVSQLIFGPLSDRYGRKPLILGGMVVFAAASVAAAFATDFWTLLVFRAIQGLGTAALRVVALALVRDCFSGAAMGRVMSISFAVFMIVPIVAPAIGQVITLTAGWRAIFGVLAAAGALLAGWVGLRLSETLDPADQRPINMASLWEAFVEIVTNRVAAGYTIAMTVTFIALFAYVICAQQIYGELYGLGVWFPAVFAATSIGMAITSLKSASIVNALGMRPVIHWGVVVFAASGLVLWIAGLFGLPPLALTFATITIAMISFGIFQAQGGALAMEPLGHVAGMASSIIGVFSTTVGVVGGGLVGAAYNGTIVPLGLAYAACGIFAVGVLAWTERGRLFKR